MTTATFLALFLMKNKVKTTLRTGEQLKSERGLIGQHCFRQVLYVREYMYVSEKYDQIHDNIQHEETGYKRVSWRKSFSPLSHYKPLPIHIFIGLTVQKSKKKYP